jgi:hypothetical protein
MSWGLIMCWDKRRLCEACSTLCFVGAWGFSSIRCHGSAKRAVVTRKLEFKGKNSKASLDVYMSSYEVIPEKYLDMLSVLFLFL